MKAGRSHAAIRHAEFDALYQRLSREVWALLYARRMSAEVAMDLTQEAFLRLWKQWEQGEEIVNPRAWLLRVARNLAEDYTKSSFHRNGTQPPQVMNGIQAGREAPLEHLERQETFQRLRDELALLGPADREVLTLRYAMDYNANQIADVLAISVTAVHMRLSRARQRLAERLTAQGIVEEP